jgi:pimeloyl-ACP methyl ester carboxylesterase
VRIRGSDSWSMQALRAIVRARWLLLFLFVAAWGAPAYAQTCNAPNLALGGVATALSTYPGYSAAHVNDGDRSTTVGPASSWANAAGGGMQLDLTLPGPVRIDRVLLFTTQGWEAHSYDVQLRVGGNWITVDSVRGNTAVSRDHRFPAQTADAVRMIGIIGSAAQAGYFRINELEIYDCQTLSQTTLRGRIIRFGTNTGLANVTVNIGGGRATTTDAAGNFAFGGLPNGIYAVRPSLAGWTFGSDQFLIDHLTVRANGSEILLDDIEAYDRNPIVYVTGFNANRSSFDPVYDELPRQGYRSFDAAIQTDFDWTPALSVNALRVRDRIDEARYTTGQPRVILFGYSMGGLVSRAYVESALYRNDVSQMFTFGSPHRGVPSLMQLACTRRLPGVCEMTKPGMLLFNLTHGQRPGVAYHVIGGDAPMWRQQQICFRILWRRICIRSIPLPDHDFRNAGGWLMGQIIPDADDGFIQTYSSTGMPGLLDRMTTQEVHSLNLGRRDYFEWESGFVPLSQQAYRNCVVPVLVARSRANCGSVSRQLPFGQAFRAPAWSSGAAVQDGFERRSRNEPRSLGAGERIEREILVDGSPTLFTARWGAGGARVTLIDPSGQVFDPAFAANVYDGEPAPGEPVDDTLDPSMVLYTGDGTFASYQFPAPRAGRWRMIVEGDRDIPSGGTALETGAAFTSDLDVTFDNEFPFYVAGSEAELVLTPTSALFSADADVVVRDIDGKIASVPMVRQGDGTFRGTYRVPNAPGIAEVSWSVTGTTATGQAFERGGSDAVQIGRQTLIVGSVRGEIAIPDDSDTAHKRYAALEVPVEVRADYAGPAMVSADLADNDGNVVAHATQQQDVTVGSNDTRLRFAGEDLYASGRDGPYRLTNLITTDQREAPLLSDWLLDQLVTRAYDHRVFAPAAAP